MVRSRHGRAGRDEPGAVVVRRPVWSRRRSPTAAAALARSRAARRPSRAAVLGLLGLLGVLVAATALRVWSLDGAQLNPFYDAAVRSMDLSWHNFFFGALEPSGRISVDKPPIDLWLQVASTTLIGFNPTALLLPEALGGILACGFLYATIRPLCGTLAAALAGLALAVLPISVVTSRSDTMDSVMMALLVGALWASVRGLRTRRIRWVAVAAGIVGVAFNVKLSEALVPLPALALIWWAVARGWRPRVAAGAGAAAALVTVGMLWIVIASLTSVGDRPYPIGSRNGSIYQAVFVYNGVERLNGTSAQVAPVASASSPGPTRLVASDHPFYGSRIGVELVAALGLGIACALAWFGSRARGAAWPVRAAPLALRRPTVRTPPPEEEEEEEEEEEDGLPAAPPAPVDGEAYARRWLIGGLIAWLLTGIGLFSAVRDLEPRYLEAISPALAGILGIAGGALLRRAAEPLPALLLAVVLAVSTTFAVLVGSVPLIAVLACVAASALAIAALVARRPRLHPALLGLACTTALFAAPIGVSVDQIADNATAAGTLGAGDQFSAYLKAHRHGAYYEVASASVYAITTLIVKDGQPVLVLNDFHGPIVPLPKLIDLVRRGAVRDIVISRACRSGPHCPLTTRWSLKHAREVVRGGLWEYVLPISLPPRCKTRPHRPGCPQPAKPRSRAAAARPGPFDSVVVGSVLPAPIAAAATP